MRKSEIKVVINTSVSPAVATALEEIAERLNTTKRAVIEELILKKAREMEEGK